MTTAHYIAIYLAFHALCGWLAWGIGFAYFQREWPSLAKQDEREDLCKWRFTGLFGGPISLIVMFLMSDFAKHGLMWRAPKPEKLCGEPHPDRTQPPPGWTIVVNQRGEFGAKMQEGRTATWLGDGGTLKSAVAKAWEIENGSKPCKWTPLPK